MVTTVKILSVAVRFSLRSMQVFLSKKQVAQKRKERKKTNAQVLLYS